MAIPLLLWGAGAAAAGGAWLKDKYDDFFNPAPAATPAGRILNINPLKVAMWLAIVWGAVKIWKLYKRRK